MKSGRLNVVTVVLYLLPFFVFSVVALLDINFSGVRQMEATLDHPISNISQLFPAQRLRGVQDGKQQVINEPVYFRVRYPRSYNTATVTLTVDNPESFPWSIGLERKNAGEWAYDLKEPDDSGTVQFNLNGAQVTDRWIRFIISIDHGDTSIDQFFVDTIRVTLND